MNAEKTEADRNHGPNDSTTTHANGSSPIKSREFARRAKALISKLPSSLDAQMARSPYTTLGIAVAIGVGAGMLLGSRILRSVLASAASYAAIEFARACLRQTAFDAADHAS
jgi:hypothetical protein